MADQVDKLILQVENAEKIKDLTKDLAQYEASLKSLAQQYKNNPIGFATAARADAERVIDLTRQIKRLEGQTRDLGRGVLEASHAFQDFVQGGVGGVLNNIPGLVEKFGGTAGLAGALGAIGVAAYVATPLVKGLWNSFTGDGAKLPETNDLLEALKTRLDESKKALKEMSDNWGGSAAEVQKYNDRLAESIGLEKKANAERERRSAIEAAEKADYNSDAGKIVQNAIKGGGGFDDVANAARNALDASSPEVAKARGNFNDVLKANQEAASSEGIGGILSLAQAKARAAIRKAQEQVDAATAANAAKSQDLVIKAGKGDQDAIAKLAELVPGGGFNAATKEGMASTKESEEAAKQAAKDQEEREKARAKADEARDKEREKDEAAERKAALTRTNNAYTQREKNAKEAGRAEKAADKADAADDRLNAKLAREADQKANGRLPAVDPSVTQRRAIGEEFAQRSAQEGYNFNPQQIDAAARSIQQSVNQGGNLGQSMQQAFMALAQNVNAMQAQQAGQAQWWQRAAQQQQVTRTRMSRNRP